MSKRNDRVKPESPPISPGMMEAYIHIQNSCQSEVSLGQGGLHSVWSFRDTGSFHLAASHPLEQGFTNCNVLTDLLALLLK